MKNLKMLIRLLFVFLTISILSAQNISSIPSEDQIVKIFINTPSGWSLQINSNGSGELIFGSSFGDYARIPQNAFSFKDIYKILIPDLTSNWPGEKSITVFLHLRDTTNQTYYIINKKIALEIIAQARTKLLPTSNTRFQELLTNNPPEISN